LASVITLVESLTTIDRKPLLHIRDGPLFFEGKELGNFRKIIPTQQKLLKKKIVQGEPWAKNQASAFHF